MFFVLSVDADTNHNFKGSYLNVKPVACVLYDIWIVFICIIV